jgi:hypothetical protein
VSVSPSGQISVHRQGANYSAGAQQTKLSSAVGGRITVARYILASTPVNGHVAPMIGVATTLVEAGHHVRFLTGALFQEAVETAGVRYVPLPAAVDYDARDLDAVFPDRPEGPGLRRLTFDMRHTLLEPMPTQAEALRHLVDAEPVDAVLVGSGFLGAVPMLLDPRPRPAVVGVGVLPLTLSSRDTAPFGLGMPPSANAAGRVRNRLLSLVVRHAVFGADQRRLDRTLHQMGLPASPVFFLDWAQLADRVLQLSVPGFEYPRSDLPGHVRFVGIAPAYSAAGDWSPPPSCWPPAGRAGG